ncbi:MAG TPA: PP2C family protein-serine/threonine phosphatase [Acidobacteriota bacterium]|nr:PP2C family protein-serine/threonine phosphatase [Acidobacteriota bacterium]
MAGARQRADIYTMSDRKSPDQESLGLFSDAPSLLERHTEQLWLFAALLGIAGVAYADYLVVSISLGYLYVLPLSLSALTQRLRVTLILVAICVVLHDLLGPYEHAGWPILYRNVLTTTGFTTVAVLVSKLAGQRSRLEKVVRAQRNELALEMTYAAQIQQRLLPKNSPDIQPFQLFGMMSPARQLGGDYYDYFHLPQGDLGIVIADVSGKGAEAALFMPSIEVALRMETHAIATMEEVIGRLNKVLYEVAEQTHYVTLFYTWLDVPSRRIQFANAGHFPPFILRSGNDVLWLTQGGPPVGLLPEATYETANMDLLPGDILVFYTDGVIEAENTEGEEYSKDRLVELIRTNSAMGARELVHRIHSSVLAFTGTPELQDDFTLVVLKLPMEEQAPNVNDFI